MLHGLVNTTSILRDRPIGSIDPSMVWGPLKWWKPIPLRCLFRTTANGPHQVLHPVQCALQQEGLPSLILILAQQGLQQLRGQGQPAARVGAPAEGEELTPGVRQVQGKVPCHYCC